MSQAIFWHYWCTLGAGGATPWCDAAVCVVRPPPLLPRRMAAAAAADVAVDISKKPLGTLFFDPHLSIMKISVRGKLLLAWRSRWKYAVQFGDDSDEESLVQREPFSASSAVDLHFFGMNSNICT